MSFGFGERQTQDGISHTGDLPVKGVRENREGHHAVMRFQRPFEPASGESLTTGAHSEGLSVPWNGCAEYPQRAGHELRAARAAGAGGSWVATRRCSL